PRQGFALLGGRETMMLRSIARASCFALLLPVGCGGVGAAAQTARPEAPTGAAALCEPTECHDVSGGAKPLVVDWKPEQRVDLEVAMSDGLAVVKYDC